jgi:hypothetical protein
MGDEVLTEGSCYNFVEVGLERAGSWELGRVQIR